MLRLLPLLLLPVVASVSCAPRVDRLLVGGTVHLPDGVRAVAVAVSDGRIVALVEPDAEAAWRRRALEVVELSGAHVYPGFTEGHAHFASLGRAAETVDLTGTESFAAILDRVRAAAGTLPAGAWVEGRGWDQNDWPERRFPHHRELSAALPDRPVLLRRVDGHAALANAAALAAAGIGRATPDPVGGRILRDGDGEPTGVLVDAAVELVDRIVPKPNAADLERWATIAARRLAALGLTEIHDAGTTADELAALRRLHQQGRLAIRVYVMLDGSDDALLDAEFAAQPGAGRDGMLAVRAVKLYADGALGSRGAWLSRPYSDDPASSGLEVTSEARLAAVVRRAAAAGFQVGIHAIGDAGVSRALDVFARELGPGGRGLRPRIEHAQVVRPEDVERFAALGVIASVQPTHCTSDMPWAGERLGETRIGWAYRWRSLLRAGVRLSLGSDAPIESPDPRLGIWAAVTRRPLSGGPAGGWNPGEALTTAEAVAGYTSWPAWAAFEEEWRGAIRPTGAADLTVLDRDLEACSAEQVAEARVLRTVVAGRDAYVAGATP